MSKWEEGWRRCCCWSGWTHGERWVTRFNLFRATILSVCEENVWSLWPFFIPLFHLTFDCWPFKEWIFERESNSERLFLCSVQFKHNKSNTCDPFFGWEEETRMKNTWKYMSMANILEVPFQKSLSVERSFISFTHFKCLRVKDGHLNVDTRNELLTESVERWGNNLSSFTPFNTQWLGYHHHLFNCTKILTFLQLSERRKNVLLYQKNGKKNKSAGNKSIEQMIRDPF